MNPLRGLRGDAKELWRCVRSKDDARLALRSYTTTMELHSILKRHQPMVVVWAGGYGWSGVPFLNERGDVVDIAVDGKGQALVEQGCLQKIVPNPIDGSTSVVPIPDCYATGECYNF